MKKNYFNYNFNENTSTYGYFNIYQSVNGKIQLQMGNKRTELSFKQIEDLHIDVYSLQDFDYDLFKKAYELK